MNHTNTLSRVRYVDLRRGDLVISKNFVCGHQLPWLAVSVKHKVYGCRLTIMTQAGKLVVLAPLEDDTFSIVRQQGTT